MTHPKISKMTVVLVDKLRKLFDDTEFITGILDIVDDEEGRKTILDFIRNRPDADIKTVTMLALEISGSGCNVEIV